MGTVTKTIGSGGGRDYSTIQSWEDALPANLVTDGNAQVGQCFNDSEFTGNGIVTISGETTDATNSITLQCGSGQSFRDNASVRSNALDYNQANGVACRSTSNYTTVVQISTNNVTVDGLQLKGAVNAVVVQNDASPVTVQNCIILGQNSASGAQLRQHVDSTFVVRNCLIRNTGAGQRVVNGQDGGFMQLYFCTIWSINGAQCIGAVNSHLTIQNCLVYGGGIDFSGGTITSANNQTDQASPPAGFTQQTGTQITNSTDGSFDGRLAAGAAAQGAGASDTTNGAFDISGLARPQGSNWDVGCWELATAAAAAAAWARRFSRILGVGPHVS
jgi:hypothetical protein